MNFFKKTIKCYLKGLIFFAVSLLFITLLSYFNILSNIKIFKLLIPIITILIISYKAGKISLKKGYLNGLYMGLSFILLNTFINLLFYHKFSIKLLIYYLIIILVSILGGILGITKKSSK